MSFSFRNLFSQDKPADPPEAAGSPTDAGKPEAGEGNPFSSAPFSNVFSNAGADEPAPASKPFVPNPLPTGRGSFEALFASQGIGGSAPAGSAPTPTGPTEHYTLREILPFLPPSLVSHANINLDRTVAIPMPADGSGEVKLTTIQRVCPELFATAITPLNDSEITLPRQSPSLPAGPAQQSADAAPWSPIGAGAPGDRTVSAPASAPALTAAPEAAARPRLAEPVATPAMAVAAAPVAASANPFAAPAGAPIGGSGGEKKPGFPIGNPFSASPTELKGAPPAVAAHSSPPPPGGFGFPEPKAPESPFGAFGSAPQPAVSPFAEPIAPPTAAPGANPWSGGNSPAGSSDTPMGIDLGLGEDSPFAPPKAGPKTPEPPASPPVAKPEAHTLPWKLGAESGQTSHSPFGPTSAGESAAPVANPFAGPPVVPKTPEANPFDAPSPAAPTAPEAKKESFWPFGADSTPASEREAAGREPNPLPATEAKPAASSSPGSAPFVFPWGDPPGGSSAAASSPSPFDAPHSAPAPSAAAAGPNLSVVSPWELPAPAPREAAPATDSVDDPFAAFAAKGTTQSAPESAAQTKKDAAASWELPKSFFGPSDPGQNASSNQPTPFDFSSPWGPLDAPQPQAAAISAEKSTPTPLAAPAGTGETVVFTLAELLRPLAKELGIDLAAMPPSAKVRLPVSLLLPQMESGEPAVTVRDLITHGDSDGIRVLAGVNPMARIPLPENELFHQITEFSPELDTGALGDLDSQFSTLFGTEARLDAGLGWQNEVLEDELPEAPAAPKPAPMATPASQPEPVAGPDLTIAGSLPVEEKPAVTSPKRRPEAPAPAAAPKPVKKAINISSTVTPQPAPSSQPAPKPGATSDPFAPLPRRTDPAAADETTPVIESENASNPGFFDDLELFAHAAGAQATSELGDAPEEFEDDADSAFPASDEEHWGFSGFATLEDLEPLAPAPPAPQPKAAPKPAAPAKAVASAAKSPKISVSVQKPAVSSPRVIATIPAPAAKAAPAQPEVVAETAPDKTGFFEELETVPTPVAAPAPASAPVAQASAPVATPAPAPAQPVATSPAPSVGDLSAKIFPLPAAPESASLVPRDIELRAVFGTNESFSFRRVADLTAGLPGILACAIIAPGCTAQAPRGRESGDLAVQAGALLNGVREIARATGMPNAETFTLHTDQGLISVFLHGDHCLTVRHQVGQFDPGVREKLILVTRGLAALEG